jgi:hypothetical protein
VGDQIIQVQAASVRHEIAQHADVDGQRAQQAPCACAERSLSDVERPADAVIRSLGPTLATVTTYSTAALARPGVLRAPSGRALASEATSLRPA